MLLFVFAKGQNYSTTMNDTAMVRMDINAIHGDTTYRFDDKKSENYKHLIAYYDAKKSKPAIDLIWTKTNQYDEIEKQWYINGQLKSITKRLTTDNGRIKLDISMWYSNGTLKYKWEAKDSDTIYCKEYYISGKLRKFDKFIWNSKLHMNEWCHTEEFYKNGQLEYTPYNPLNTTNIIPFEKYYENGKLRAKYLKHPFGIYGGYKAWDDEGNLIIEGQYTGNKEAIEKLYKAKDYQETKKIGKWVYYNKSGSILIEEFYDLDGNSIDMIVH